MDGESFAFHSSVCVSDRAMNRGMLNEKVGVSLTNSLKGIVHPKIVIVYSHFVNVL